MKYQRVILKVAKSQQKIITFPIVIPHKAVNHPLQITIIAAHQAKIIQAQSHQLLSQTNL